MKTRYFYLCMLLGTTVLFDACKKDKIDPLTTNPSNTTKIDGYVRAANGVTPIGGAKVYTDAQHVTHSATNGYFMLEVPKGNYILTIETGDGELFKTMIPVDASAGGTITLPEDGTDLELTGNLAYIPGAYDQIEALVHDSLGYPITMLTPADLSNGAYLATFDAIFINCGAAEVYDSAQYVNLSQYIQSGGSMYVSDFGTSYLLGPYMAGCNRALGFIDDSLLCTNRVGPATSVMGATILDTDFQTAVGSSTMDIVYDLGGWEVVQNYNPTFWDVIVSDATFGPLMLRNSSYSGNGGKIYYTTFHNEPNGMGADVELMLQYVILNL